MQGEEARGALARAHAAEGESLAALLQRAAAGDRGGEAANALTCPLTMEVRGAWVQGSLG